MFQSERMRLRALKIKNANEPVLEEKRNNEFGSRFHARLTRECNADLRATSLIAEDAAFARGGAR